MRNIGAFARRGRRAFALAALALLGAGCGEGVAPPDAPTGGGVGGGSHLVALASDRGTLAGQLDIYLYDLDNGSLLPLAAINSAGSPDAAPAISPDGRYLAFQSNRGGASGYDILLYDRQVQAIAALPAVNTVAPELEPGFSADGRHLAFVQVLGFRRRVRLTADFPPSSMLALPGLDTTLASGYDDFAPSPDSTARRIAFASNRDGTPDVFVWDRDSSRVLSLPALRSPDTDTEPSITADGRLVAFSSNRPSGAGGSRILLYDIEARAFVPLPALAGAGNQRHPSVSRDASRIAFESDRAGGLGKIDVWILNRASGAVTQGIGLSSAGDDVQPDLRWR